MCRSMLTPSIPGKAMRRSLPERSRKSAGIKGIHVEGLKECDWILIDTGDYIIHLFTEEVREFYNLESLWEDLAPKLTHE